MSNLWWSTTKLYIDPSILPLTLVRVMHEHELNPRRKTGKVRYERVTLQREVVDELFENHGQEIPGIEEII